MLKYIYYITKGIPRMKAKLFSLQNLSERSARRLFFLLGGVLLLLILILALFPLLDGDTRKHEAVTYSFDTYVHQTLYGKEREAAAEDAANAVQRFADRAAWDGESSEIFTLNAQAGMEWITLSEDIFSMLLTAKDVSVKSGSAFDITLAPVSRLWDFENARCTVPDETLLSELLGYVGAENLRLGAADHSASLKFHGNAVDPQPVLFGAACNTAIETYKNYEVAGALVSVGRSVGVYGKKPDGTLWNIAVPAPEGETMLGSVSVNGGFLSSVSVYDNAFEENGRLYGSVLDPKTGYPAESELVSVTVYTHDGVLSDALAAACIVLGHDESLALLAQYGAEAVFVGEDNTVAVTPGIKDEFVLTNENFRMQE